MEFPLLKRSRSFRFACVTSYRDFCTKYNFKELASFAETQDITEDEMASIYSVLKLNDQLNETT